MLRSTTSAFTTTSVSAGSGGSVEAASRGTSDRIFRIDAFRVIAAALVVWGHCEAVGYLGHVSWPGLISGHTVNIVARCTMPFFFITSGYFIGGKLLAAGPNARSVAWPYAARLLRLFLVACAVYFFEQSVMKGSPGAPLSELLAGHVQRMLSEPILLVLNGTADHLWFLMALCLSILLAAFIVRARDIEALLAAGCALYVVGLLSGSYAVTPVGVPLPVIGGQHALFGLLFFAIGVSFARSVPAVSTRTAIFIAVAGAALHVAEGYALWRGWGVPVHRNAFLLGTVPLGVGFTLLALRPGESRLDRLVGPLGQYTLLVYLGHMAFIDLFRPVRHLLHPDIWRFLMPPLVLAASLAFAVAVSRTPLKRLAR